MSNPASECESFEIVSEYKFLVPGSVFVVGRQTVLSGMFTPGGQAIWPSGVNYVLAPKDHLYVYRAAPDAQMARWKVEVNATALLEVMLPSYVSCVYALLLHEMPKREAAMFLEELERIRRHEVHPVFAEEDYPMVPSDCAGE